MASPNALETTEFEIAGIRFTRIGDVIVSAQIPGDPVVTFPRPYHLEN